MIEFDNLQVDYVHNSRKFQGDAQSLNVPSSWCWASFEEITINYDGKRVPITSSERKNGNYPYYGASGIIDYVQDYIFDAEYLLIAEDGANLLSRSTPIAFIANGKFWVNNHAHIVQVTNNLIPLSYLEKYINATDIRLYVSGSAQPKLNQKNLNRIQIPLPPLNEQRRIVAKIEALKARSQRVKEALEDIPQLLDQFRQSVLAAAFRGDLTADWREQNPDVEPASVLLERIRVERRRRWEKAELEKMKASGKTPKDDKWKEKYKEPDILDMYDLPKLPTDWIWVKLISLFTTIGDVDHRMPQAQEDGIPYVSTKDFFKNGQINFTNAKKISQEDFAKLSRKICPEWGDILLSRYGTVGEVRLVKTTQLFQASYSIAILKTVLTSLSDFIAIGLTSELIQAQIKKYIRGVAQPDLGLAHIKELAFPVPPVSEQQVIIKRVESFFKAANTIEQQYREVKAQVDQLDQSILAKAFRGELVPQDPNDEPASVLLERIRAERAKLQTKAAKKSTPQTGGQRSKKASQQEAEPVQLELGLE